MRNNKRQGKNDSRRYEDWIECSSDDLYAASLLMKDERTSVLALFHCHQACEKAFKGFHLYHKGHSPDGHNLMYLCRQAAYIEKEFDRWFYMCVELNNFYIQSRYPTDFPLDVTAEFIKSIYNQSRELNAFVTDELADDVFD